MTRITKNQLESKLDDLNAALGMAAEPYAETRDARGGLVANAGTYVLDWAYSGVSLCQMCEGGGQRTISERGTTRECFAFVSAMLAGVYAARAADRVQAVSAVESAFFAGFSEGANGDWIEGDPSRAFTQYLAENVGAT